MTIGIELSGVRLLRNSRAVGAGIARGKVDVAAAIPDNSRALTDGEGERLEQPDLVATLRESGADVGRDGPQPGRSFRSQQCWRQIARAPEPGSSLP
jgi:hypothetical protein